MLLIDEIDRADDEFEAYLLEVLSDFQITVPELGVFRAPKPPIVILTSNRTRDVHDALKRRCLYHWVEHPDFEREVAIVRLRAPVVGETLAQQVAAAVERMRTMELYKPPGVAETIDWASALAALGRTQLDEHTVDVTLVAAVCDGHPGGNPRRVGRLRVHHHGHRRQRQQRQPGLRDVDRLAGHV